MKTPHPKHITKGNAARIRDEATAAAVDHAARLFSVFDKLPEACRQAAAVELLRFVIEARALSF